MTARHLFTVAIFCFLMSLLHLQPSHFYCPHGHSQEALASPIFTKTIESPNATLTAETTGKSPGPAQPRCMHPPHLLHSSSHANVHLGQTLSWNFARASTKFKVAKSRGSSWSSYRISQIISSLWEHFRNLVWWHHTLPLFLWPNMLRSILVLSPISNRENPRAVQTFSGQSLHIKAWYHASYFFTVNTYSQIDFMQTRSLHHLYDNDLQSI